MFPQLVGLGRSEISRFYGIRSLAEARAYVAHPVLGGRLRAAAEAILMTPDRTAEAILGPVDAVKLRSSMTLFLRAAPDDAVFLVVLQRFYDGRVDATTDALLESGA